jgi:hypothetical protein
LRDQSKTAEAEAEFRAALRGRPDYPEAHCNLGKLLSDLGRYDEALAEVLRGHELGSKRPVWRYPSAEWVRRAERMAALAKRLPVVLKGDDKPTNALEGIDLALMAYRSRHFATAARLYAGAMESDATLAADRRRQPAYNAARSAALAAAGQGNDDPKPDEAARAKLRGQALGWLTSELSAWSRLLASGPPPARPIILRTLRHWKEDPDLTAVRDPDALAKLPAPERDKWQALWADVDRRLQEAAKAP